MTIFKRDKKAKRKFALLNALFIASGLLQGLSVALTIPFFKTLFAGDFGAALQWLIYIAATSLACFIFHFVGANVGNHMSVWEVCDSKTRQVGSSIIKLPLGWFDASSKGKVSKAVSTDINTLSHYPPIVLPEILTVLTSSAVVALALLFLSPIYALIILLMIPLMYLFWRQNYKALQTVESESVQSNQKMESTIVEFAQLQPVLRASGALLDGWDRLNAALNDDKAASLKTLKKKAENSFKYMFVVNVGTIVIMVLAALQLKGGAIELYTFVGVVVAMMRFANPLAGLLGYLSEVFNVESALNRLNAIVEADRLSEPSDGVELNCATANGLEIAFKDVEFSYVSGTKVLDNVNLTVPAGRVTALVGASGGGKSTINKLIARFWDVDKGAITIDGKNIKEIKTADLMRAISMVFQEVYLFNTTIKENLAIAKPDATDGEIMDAAKKARLDEVIARLPNGWDTMVGEGGSSLSGGEKQRVSIARAFLKDAPILLLDEITSALDGVNEAVITKSIEALSKNRTVVVIAHRLSSIKNADAIAVVDSGKIIGYGSHDQLLEHSQKYQKLWRALQNSELWQV